MIETLKWKMWLDRTIHYELRETSAIHLNHRGGIWNNMPMIQLQDDDVSEI